MIDQGDKYKIPSTCVCYWGDQEFDRLQTMPQLAFALEKADENLHDLDRELSQLKANLEESEKKLERVTLARDRIRRIMMGLLQETKTDG